MSKSAICQESLEIHYRSTGKERDSESGLDYFGARYYVSKRYDMASRQVVLRTFFSTYSRMQLDGSRSFAPFAARLLREPA